MPTVLVALPYAARIGGVESWFGDLVQCLPPRGWQVKALAVSPTIVTGWSEPSYWPHVETIGRPWWAVRDYVLAVREAITRLKPDLVLSFAYELPILTGPNVPPGPRVIEGVYTGLPAEVARLSEWHGYFDGLMAIGAGTREAIEAGLRDVPEVERPPIRIVRYGFRFPESPPVPPANGPIRLLWFGRVCRSVKRVFDLIPICRQLQEAGLAFTLTVLGDGPDAAEFRKATEELPPDTIRVLPVVAPHQVFDILLGHHVFLSTSECEGGPRTLLEAMSCHVVPVVTDIPGYSREVVEEGLTGFRVPVGDSAAFADRIARLDRDRSLLTRLASAARPAVTMRFSLDRMADELDAYFRQVLSLPARRRLDRAVEDTARFLAGRWPWIPPSIQRTARWAAWRVGLLSGFTV